MKKQKQKKGRKFLLARAALLLFAVLFAHNSAWAQSQTVSTITTSENLFKSSTVYVGEVVVDGESKIKYLYSGNMSRKVDVINNLLSGLQGMADDSYASLLGGIEADEEASGLALCSDPELVAEMDENWSSAQQVGTLYFTGKSVASETNSNLYDIDEGFKAKLDELTEARMTSIDEPLDAGNYIITHLDSRTVTDVYYTIEDGRVIRHIDTNVIYDSEKTTVIFTKAELVSSSDVTREFVDLGLTSGTLWATTNVGADNPQDIGLFFAWGDTEGHELEDGYLFSWENYKWGEVSGYDTYFTKYCSDSSRGKDGFTDGKAELDLEDDAAFVNWGSDWRMPSKQQLDELQNECTWTLTTLGDVQGYNVEGPNGNSIFLPATGWRLDDMLLDGGAYWSRSGTPDDVGGAFYLGWDDWGFYEFGGRCDGQCVRPVIYRLIELAANEDNSEVINNAADDGGTYDVKLCDRTLYKDGTWNTLCLPFSLNEDQIETMLESPQQIKTLSTTEFDPETGTLTLNFEEVTTIGAGMAYIIKWEPSENPDNSDYSDYSDYSDNSENSELRNPIFSGVTLSDTYTSYVTEYAEFIGTTSPMTLAAGDRTVLYLGANNTLYSPSVDKVIKSCYAYFQLRGGITAGDKANQVRSFRLNFGDGEATDISLFETDSQQDAEWYTIDGRRMNGKPTAKGLYINKGQKLFIK